MEVTQSVSDERRWKSADDKMDLEVISSVPVRRSRRKLYEEPEVIEPVPEKGRRRKKAHEEPEVNEPMPYKGRRRKQAHVKPEIIEVVQGRGRRRKPSSDAEVVIMPVPDEGRRRIPSIDKVPPEVIVSVSHKRSGRKLFDVEEIKPVPDIKRRRRTTAHVVEKIAHKQRESEPK